MISKEDLDYLKQLDGLRVEARMLRDKGLEAIVAFSLEDDTHWEQEISDNEKLLFRRAKHLAWNLGKIEEYDCEHLDVQYFSKEFEKPQSRPQKYRRRVNYPDWPIIVLPVLRLNDITNAAGLCRKLKVSTDPLSNYLRDQFAPKTSALLEAYTSSTHPPIRPPVKAILRELNKVLPSLSLQDHLAQVTLAPETRSLLAQNPQGADLLRLNRMLLTDAYPDEITRLSKSVELFEMPGEPAPILFAANFLRTRLGNLAGCLDEGTLSCYYRVIRELYNLHHTNWALGAARPGEHSGKPSVFVTMECARAIGYFARLMENTAHFLRRMHETKEYVQHVKSAQSHDDPFVPPLHPAWCKSELEWCSASAKTTIEGFRDYVAILLPDLKGGSDLDEILRLVETSVKYFANVSAESFRTVIQWSKLLREREVDQFSKWRRKQRRSNRKESLRQLPEPDLTETAHRVAWGALAAARHDFKRLRRESNSSKVLLEASDVFADLAKWLRTHLDPSKEYFEKNLHRCLTENARGGSPNLAPDLAFSALSLGLITKDWYRPDCRQAIEILCENLDERGQFPVGAPFAYTAKGEGRVVINAQLIRAFAQLAQRLTSNLDAGVKAEIPKVIGRMLGYFQSQSIELKQGIAWPSLRALNRERSCLWISSISALALHRIVLMLDAHINHGVKEHFNTKSATELKEEGVPYLHELMCSDIGYVSLGNESPSPTRVVMELEGMRAHLLGSGRAKKALRAKETLGELPLRSLILHGPPGTGKTTLVKSLAVSSNVDLVEVMSHDLYGPGTERVMEQTSHVMDALKLLTSSVILFDEFEPILHSRPEKPVRITEMLTGNMLPKLDALYKAAGQNGIAYVLSTNYVERLDSAAIRVGRFDRMRFIYYPDAASRVCRLVSEFRHLMNRFEAAEISMPPAVAGSDRRLMEVVAKSARRYINHLCRSGWFVTPRRIKTTPAPTGLTATGSSEMLISPQTLDALSPVWKYIIWNQGSEEIGWDLFGSAEKMIDPDNNPSDKTGRTGIEGTIVKMVKDWDDELRNIVFYHPYASWQQIMDLLSKPIDIGKRSSSSSARAAVEVDSSQQPDRSTGRDRRSGIDRRSGSDRRRLLAGHADLVVERRLLPDRRISTRRAGG